MILLQSKDIFDDLLRMDAATGKMERLQRSKFPELEEAPINGTFVYLGGHRLMFYRLEGQLRFAVDGLTVKIDDEVISGLENEQTRRIFKLMKESKELLSFKYDTHDLEPQIPGDTTPFIGEEDFDFCQFVHNVLNNPQRRNFIYRDF